MRAGGRSRTAAPVGLHILIYLYVSIKLAASSANEYGVPIEIKLWDTGRTPLALLVDVTNGFGLKVLAEHNFLNDNNIAFSPYGLMGILVALYEGVDGEASYQIQRGMQLPWNRNVMRVGFRDIHRTLKTYFVPEEGFLAGLALNNENVTFNESYKNVLRFYGFDLENDKLPTLPPANGTNDTTTTAAPMTTEGGGETTPTTISMTADSTPAREDTASTQSREETTTNPNAETINDVDIRGPTTTVSPSSAPNAESTTVLATTADQEPSTEQETTTQTEQMTTQTTPTIAPTTIAPTTMPSTPEATTTEAQTSPTSSAPLTDEPTINNEVDAGTTPNIPSTTASTANETSTTTAVTETQSTLMMETESTATTMSENMSTLSETQQTEEGSTPADITTLADVATTTANESNLETLERRKKSIVDFIFTSPPYFNDYIFYRSYDIPIAPEYISPNLDNTMFLVNGLRNVQVTYMHYDTVLEHAYLPHLEASALRLPLDSERYYLLVVLPTRGGAPELGRLLARMARESDLSDVYAALRPRRVRAIVPSFTVKGHVTLTTDLQKLGIRDVFEPRQRDFTPMTHQAGVYVRSIEQAVSVAIRKYRPDDQKKNRYVINRQPVSFSATYPFLYFVMDSSIHVALMAGKMVDPLNSRIL